MMFPELRGREKSQHCLGLGDTQAWDPRICRESQACLTSLKIERWDGREGSEGKRACSQVCPEFKPKTHMLEITISSKLSSDLHIQ